MPLRCCSFHYIQKALYLYYVLSPWQNHQFVFRQKYVFVSYAMPCMCILKSALYYTWYVGWMLCVPVHHITFSHAHLQRCTHSHNGNAKRQTKHGLTAGTYSDVRCQSVVSTYAENCSRNANVRMRASANEMVASIFSHSALTNWPTNYCA